MSEGTPYVAPPIDFSQLSSPGSTSTETSSTSSTIPTVNTTSTPPPSDSRPAHNTTAPGDQLVNAPAPDSAYLDHAEDSTVPRSAAELSPADKAPAPATEQLSETDGSAQAVREERSTPASNSIPQGDQAPRPAVESTPVASQRVAADAPIVKEPTAVPLETAVTRPPTSSEPLDTRNGVPLAQADITPPATSKPILPSAQGHIAEHPSTATDTDHVLPLGSDVHPVSQAAALEDAPDHLVNAQIEKQKADKRELEGKEPQGTIVPGFEDDRLWAMIRRFDVVSFTLTPSYTLHRSSLLPLHSKSLMYSVHRLDFPKENPIFDLRVSQQFPSTRTNSSRISNESTLHSESTRSTPREK